MANQTAPARAAESIDSVYIVSMNRPLAAGVPIRFYRESLRSAPLNVSWFATLVFPGRRLARSLDTIVAFPKVCLLAHDGHDDVSLMCGATVFEEKDPLPGA